MYAPAARTAGLALNDYLVLVLARAHHLPVPAENRPDPPQHPTSREESPLNRAAQ